MPTKRYYLKINFLLIFLPLLVTGQNLKIVPGKSSININDEYTLTIIAPLTKQLKTSAFPEIEDFSKKQTEYLKEDSVFRIVQHYSPRKSGIFELLPFTFYVNNQKIIYQNTIKITVKGNKRNVVNEYKSIQFSDSELKAYLEISSDKKEVFTGQGFTLSASLLISEPNKAEYNFIDFKEQVNTLIKNVIPKNCLAENLTLATTVKKDSIRKFGLKFTRYLLYSATFYPLTAENIEFKKIGFTLLSYDEHKKPGLILRKDHLFNLNSTAFTVKVKPLPELQNFPGLVGKFGLKEKIGGRKPEVRKSFVYDFTITGKGNLSMAKPPAIHYSGRSFEIYPVLPATQDSSKITYSYKIIPREAGILNLQKVFSWTYYNVEKQKADTLFSRSVVSVSSTNQAEDTTYSYDPFYNKIRDDSNKLKNMEKDNMLNLFTNLVILFMFAVTVVLIIRK